MGTLIWWFGLFFIGFYIGSRVSPAIKNENGEWYLHYNSKRGCRNKKRLKF